LEKVAEEGEESRDRFDGFLHTDSYRPEKTRKMLANRACRNAIMVGRTLSKKQMKDIVVGLSGLE
jgi:DNA mismatch repair ATPase MutL